MTACSHRHGLSGDNNLLAWDLAHMSAVYSSCVVTIPIPKVSVCIFISLYFPDVTGPSVDKLVLTVAAKGCFWSEASGVNFQKLKRLDSLAYSCYSPLLIFSLL